MDHTDLENNLGITRRTLIRRGAIVGGTLMWAAPAVQTFAKPALAQGSANCLLLAKTSNGGCFVVGECSASTACCDCVDQHPGAPPGSCPACDTADCRPVRRRPC